MDQEITFDCPVHFKIGTQGRKRLVIGEAPDKPEPGSIPRITKLMALAIQFEEKLAQGDVRDLAHIATLGHVTRARVTQIMNLRLLAPDIQEALLGLPRTTKGRDPIQYRHIFPITMEPDWNRQRQLWRELNSSGHP